MCRSEFPSSSESLCVRLSAQSCPVPQSLHRLLHLGELQYYITVYLQQLAFPLEVIIHHDGKVKRKSGLWMKSRNLGVEPKCPIPVVPTPPLKVASQHPCRAHHFPALCGLVKCHCRTDEGGDTPLPSMPVAISFQSTSFFLPC